MSTTITDGKRCLANEAGLLRISEPSIELSKESISLRREEHYRNSEFSDSEIVLKGQPPHPRRSPNTYSPDDILNTPISPVVRPGQFIKLAE